VIFFLSNQNVFSNINRILSDAVAFVESSHYASQHVRQVAARLDRTWKEFAGWGDERTTALALSVLFHQRAQQYAESVAKWSQACEGDGDDTGDGNDGEGEIPALESAIHRHQALYESMCQVSPEPEYWNKRLKKYELVL